MKRMIDWIMSPPCRWPIVAQALWAWGMGFLVAAPVGLSLLWYACLHGRLDETNLYIMAMAVCYGLFWGLVTGPSLDDVEKRQKARKTHRGRQENWQSIASNASVKPSRAG